MCTCMSKAHYFGFLLKSKEKRAAVCRHSKFMIWKEMCRARIEKKII